MLKQVHPSIREVAVLQEATEMILSCMDIDTVLHQILLIVRNYFGVSYCAVFLVDATTNELVLHAHIGYRNEYPHRRLAIGRDGVTGRAAASRSPMYVPDVRREPVYLSTDPEAKSELALPLIVRDQVIGVLDVESDKLDYFTEDSIGLLMLFAGQAAVALENARLYSTERRRMRQVELINLIARSSTSATDLSLFLGTLADLIADTFEGSEVSVLLKDNRGGLELRAHAGQEAPAPADIERAHRTGILRDAMTRQVNVLIPDRAHAPGQCLVDQCSGTELCVPLVSIEEAMGAIVISHPRANCFTSDDRAVAQAAADVCATAIKNLQLTEELRRVVNSDSLTGLFNQRYFHTALAKEIQRSRRYDKHFAVLMLDIAGFRRINEEFGFEGGDSVLQQLARLAHAHVRAIDIVCRYAADRLALILPETDSAHVQAVLSKLDESLANVALTSGPLRLSAVAVQAQFPADGSSDRELLLALTNRLAEAKKRRAACV